MPTRQTDIVMIALVIFLLVCAAALWFTSPSWAHHAKSGWAYDGDCCSDQDCRQLPDGAVKITSGGYEWGGETFPYSSPKIRPSGDGHYHGCEMMGDDFRSDNGGGVYRPCLYVPHGGV